MLNPFPELLVYSMLAPFLLRIVIGFIFIDLGLLLFKGEKERWILSFNTLRIPNPKLVVKIIGVVEIVGGIALLLGAYTQVVALVLALLTFVETYIEYKNPELIKRTFVFYLLIFIITLSLLFSGAGAFAIDLPL